MYQVLYRKYRPKVFSDVYGQDHVTSTLKNEIKNGRVSHDEMQQLSNQLKSMFTNDGNVLLFNIHVVPGHTESVVFPASLGELNGNGYGEKLYNMASLLPLNYNEQMRAIFGDKQADIRYHAMGVNTGMERLVKMMKIGTLSSMFVNNNQ